MLVDLCLCSLWLCFVFFFKQKTAYEMRISDWSSDVCSSDLYQGILGVSYDVTDELKAYLDYRYFATEDLKGTTPAGADVDVENESPTGMIGVRYMFGAPRPAETMVAPPASPPPPPPVMTEIPAPQHEPVVRSSLVFFSFNRSALTPDARRIVETAAQTRSAENTSELQSIMRIS